MSGFMTLPAFVVIAVVCTLIGWFARDLRDVWARWREGARQWAHTIGDPNAPVYPDLVRDAWVSPGSLAGVAPPLTPRRPLRAPGTTLPQRLPGAALVFEPAPAPVVPIDWLSLAAPGRPVPRTAAEAVSRKARHGDPDGYWAVNEPALRDTQLMPAVVDDEDETRALPAVSTAEQFYGITRANWPTQERAALSDWRCAHCVANRHGDCPGCECPCTTDAYVEVSRG